MVPQHAELQHRRFLAKFYASAPWAGVVRKEPTDKFSVRMSMWSKQFFHSIYIPTEYPNHDVSNESPSYLGMSLLHVKRIPAAVRGRCPLHSWPSTCFRHLISSFCFTCYTEPYAAKTGFGAELNAGITVGCLGGCNEVQRMVSGRSVKCEGPDVLFVPMCLPFSAVGYNAIVASQMNPPERTRRGPGRSDLQLKTSR